MAVEPIIPPEWPFIYTLAVGQDWPQADEDALRRVAQAWTDALAALVQISDHGQRATDDVHYSVQSRTVDQFDEYWKQYTTGDDSAVGQLARQCQAVAEQLLDFADQTEFTKLAIDIQVVLLLIQVTYDLVIAPLTGGLSMGEAFAAMFFTRTIVRELISRIVEMVLFATVPDLISQSIMVAEGHRQSIDMHELGQAAQMGVIGGALAFGAGRVLGRFTPGLTKAFGARGGAVARAAITGGVANLGTVSAVNAVDAWEDRNDPNKQYGFADWKAGQNPLAVIANGVFTGVLFHGLHEFSARPSVHFQTDLGGYTGVQTGDNTFTLFPESGSEHGKMQLATLGDDGVLSIRRGIGASYEAVPTEFSLNDNGTIVHAVFTDGVPSVTSIEHVATGHEPPTFTHEGRVWTVPKDSVITYTPRDNGYVVRTPEGPVYAGGDDGSLSLVGRITTDPSGATRHFLPGVPDPVTAVQFHAAVEAAQHPGSDSSVAAAPTVVGDGLSTVHSMAGHAIPGHTEAAPVAFDDPASRQVALAEEYADLRGQVQRTPAGMGGYHADDEPMWRAAHAFERVPGRFLVDMHGNSDGVRVGDRNLSASELADLILAAGWNGRDAIVLLACETGAGPHPYADALSAALDGATVLAPDASVVQDPARAAVALSPRGYNPHLGTFVESGDEAGRWFAFHGDGHPTEVGTDHSGLPDPTSYEPHHADLDLNDPNLVFRKVEDPPPEGADTAGHLVKELGLRLNRAVLRLSTGILAHLDPADVQTALAERQAAWGRRNPTQPGATPPEPRRSWSPAIEVAVRRNNPDLRPLLDGTVTEIDGVEYKLEDYLALSPDAGDTEMVKLGRTVTVGPHVDLPPLHIEEDFMMPARLHKQAALAVEYLNGERHVGRYDDASFDAVQKMRPKEQVAELYKHLDNYAADPVQAKRDFNQRVMEIFVAETGHGQPGHAVTKVPSPRRIAEPERQVIEGGNYDAIAEGMGVFRDELGLSNQQLARAIRHAVLGDTGPMDDFQRLNPDREVVIKQRNMLAALGRLVVIVEGSRHPSAMLTNAMNLAVGEYAGKATPADPHPDIGELLKRYNSMWYGGATKAASNMDARLTSAPDEKLDDWNKLWEKGDQRTLIRAIAQTERASIAAYLRLIIDPPAGMPHLAINDDPRYTGLLDHLRAGNMKPVVEWLSNDENLDAFLSKAFAEIITYTTDTPNRPDAPRSWQEQFYGAGS